MGWGFSPLDEELALLPRSLTPTSHEYLVHLAAWIPFAHAAKLLERLVGVRVSATTVRRLTEAAGATLEQGQTATSQRDMKRDETTSLPYPTERKLVLSADGAYVPLVKGEWAEVRTLAIGAVAARPSSSEQEVQTCAWSYFSRLTDAATFADLAEVETRRRGVIQAAQVCAVTDGADWLVIGSSTCIGLMRCVSWILRTLQSVWEPLRISSPKLVSPCPRTGFINNVIGSSMREPMAFWRRYGRYRAQRRPPRCFRSTATIWRSGSRSRTIPPISSKAGPLDQAVWRVPTNG